MYVLFLFFVEPDFGCGFSAGIHNFGGFVCFSRRISCKTACMVPLLCVLGLPVTVAYMHVFVTGRAGMCLKK